MKNWRLAHVTMVKCYNLKTAPKKTIIKLFLFVSSAEGNVVYWALMVMRDHVMLINLYRVMPPWQYSLLSDEGARSSRLEGRCHSLSTMILLQQIELPPFVLWSGYLMSLTVKRSPKWTTVLIIWIKINLLGLYG